MSGGPDLITASIDALASGHDLTADQTAAVLAAIMAGRPRRSRSPAF